MTTVNANNYHDALNTYLDKYLSGESVLVSMERNSHMHDWRDVNGKAGGTNGLLFSTAQSNTLSSVDVPNCLQFKTILDRVVEGWR